MKYLVLGELILLIGCSGGELGVSTSDTTVFSTVNPGINFSNLEEILFSESEKYTVSEITRFSNSISSSSAEILIDYNFREFRTVQVFVITSDIQGFLSYIVLAHNFDKVTIGIDNTLPDEFLYLDLFYREDESFSFISVNYNNGNNRFNGIANSSDLIFDSNRIAYSFTQLSMNLYNYEENIVQENAATASGSIVANGYRLEGVSF